jgi:hypothetical protein
MDFLGLLRVKAVLVGCGAMIACGSADQQNPDGQMPDGELPLPPNAAVYSHTAKDLYRVNYETLEITRVGAFNGAFGTDTMTDLAMDSTGTMIGISFTQVYRVDPVTAGTTLIGQATLQQAFNGLSFVPSQLALGTAGPDVLIASRNNDGRIFQIDPVSGAVSQLGDMGAAYKSSGDIVGVHGFGMVATVMGPALGDPDVLVRLESGTFAATPIGTSVGVAGIWGLGFWKQRLFGFGSAGAFVEINPETGASTPIRTTPEMWYGAAVTTAAPTRR